MKGPKELREENDRAVYLFTDVQACANDLATCETGEIKATFDKLVTAVIKHRQFNHDTRGVSICGTLYADGKHGGCAPGNPVCPRVPSAD